MQESSGGKTKTKTTVVKCCLLKHLNRKIQRDQTKLSRLLNYIDSGTEFISKMMRRSSLIMLYHVSRINTENLVIIDLKIQNDTWWKNVLKIGLEEFKKPFPVSPNSPDSVYDIELKNSYNILLQQGLIKETLEINEKNEPPDYFDQVVAFAAELLETVTINNLWIPLINRLTRFCKAYATLYNENNNLAEDQNLSPFDLLNTIRSGNPPIEDERYGSQVPNDFIVIAKEIRSILNAPRKTSNGKSKVVNLNEFYIWDNTPKELNGDSLMQCNIWLLNWFVKNEKKGFKLVPVCNVERKNIRLDEKMLINMVNMMLKEDKPKKKDGESKGDFERRCKEHKDVLEKWNCKSYSTLQKDNPGNPVKTKLNKIKKPSQDQFIDQEAYQAACAENTSSKTPPKKKDFVDSEKYKLACDLYKKKREAVLNDPTYQNEVKEYQQFVKSKQEVARILFPEKVFHLRGKDTDYDFKASITTDGISVSFQYVKEVEVVEKEDEKTTERKKKKKDGSSCVQVKDFDSEMSFVTDVKVVGGLDPGRCSLATIVVHDPTSYYKKMSYSLSRAQYHVDSGTFKNKKRKDAQMKPLESKFTELSKTPLNSGSPQDVINYLKIYNQISKQWWEIALQRKESRAKLQSYIGKRKTLDNFFGQVKKSMDIIWGKEKKKVIAYGHAGPHMKPTGKGEMAVPTASTFKACKRIFGPENTVIEDESFTTKICSCCKCEKQPVYLDCESQIFASKTRKQIPEHFKECMGGIMDVIKLKDIVRKGGGIEAKFEERDLSKKMYYPEVRGLRFCPKCRKFLNRDKESAKSIGLLHMLRTTRNERPSCFCKKSKGASKSVDVSPMMPPRVGGVLSNDEQRLSVFDS